MCTTVLGLSSEAAQPLTCEVNRPAGTESSLCSFLLSHQEEEEEEEEEKEVGGVLRNVQTTCTLLHALMSTFWRHCVCVWGVCVWGCVSVCVSESVCVCVCVWGGRGGAMRRVYRTHIKQQRAESDLR